MYKKTIQSSLLFILFLPLHLLAQVDNKDIASIKTAIDLEYLKMVKKEKVIGLSLAVVDDGKMVYANGFGFSDLKNNIKATEETIFPIGSSTKVFTALAVMRLHEQGLLNINESIKKYIPELTINNRLNDGNKIIIKDILSHTSGLPSDVLNGMMADEPPNIDWTINELNKQYTIAPNRFIFVYSNIGYALLGELIQRVSGTSYAEYLKQEIFIPLEMHHTKAGSNIQMSKGYLKKNEVVLSGIRDYAAGCITSTASDMANFVAMMLNDGHFNGKEIFTKNTIDQIEHDHQIGTSLEASNAYGFGINVYTTEIKNGSNVQHLPAFGHSGYSPPFHADFRYIPELKVGVVVMSNTRHSGLLRSAGTILDVYLREAKGLEYQLLGKESKMENNCLDTDIPGVYSLGIANIIVNNTNKIKFKVDGTKIILKRKGNSYDYSLKAKLFGFIPIKIKDAIFRFIKIDGKMYITQMDIDRNTEEFVAAKVKKLPIPKSWEATYGQYDIVKSFPCIYDEFDFSKAKVNIHEKNGFVYLNIKTPDGAFPFVLNIDSETIAYTGGIGRQMNYVVKILKNGNVYFSGFEFRKKQH